MPTFVHLNGWAILLFVLKITCCIMRVMYIKQYSDLPLIDMIFGSFEMQRGTPRRSRFWDGASLEVRRYIVCDDVASEGALESELE